jgi:NAD(P)-dependent dehydrogenase (short-subunit alcohol dehydrogenase family)
VLVNNAGIERYTDFHSYDLDMIEKIIRVNVVAAEVLTRLVVPGMIDRARGHIVNISSVAGKSAVPYNAVYSSSKHALVGFSWSLREELKPYGIGVSVVCPGFVREAGMFADWSGGTEPPGMTRSVSPERVRKRDRRRYRARQGRNRCRLPVPEDLRCRARLIAKPCRLDRAQKRRVSISSKRYRQDVSRLRPLLAFVVAAALVTGGCSERAPDDDDHAIPARCGLPTPDRRVDASIVAEVFLLGGDAEVTKTK